jgi:pSer/pThr/pTyr-binding forkhead associated (FHA) protein
MTRESRIPVLAAVLFVSVLVAAQGLDMFSNPLVYPFLARSVCRGIGILLMAAALLAVSYQARLIWGPQRIHSQPSTGHGDSPESPASPPPASMPVEAIRKGADAPLLAQRNLPHLIGLTAGLPDRVTIQEGVFLIGRAPDCGLTLTSQLVSRHHAQLIWNGETLVLRDLGSSNSTLVNDRVADTEVRLDEGDVIKIVDCAFEVELPASLAKTIQRRPATDLEEPDPEVTLPMEEL